MKAESWNKNEPFSLLIRFFKTFIFLADYRAAGSLALTGPAVSGGMGEINRKCRLPH